MGKIFLVLIILLLVLVVLAFAGVEPISTYKDNLFSSIGDFFQKSNSTIKNLESTPTTISNANIPQADNSIPVTETIPNLAISPTEGNTASIPVTKTPPPQSAFIITDVTTSLTPAEMKQRLKMECNITIYIQATEAAQPGYYSFELYDKYQTYWKKDIKYLRGDTLEPFKCSVTGGNTWLDLEQGINPRTLFQVNSSYSSFVEIGTLFPSSGPLPIENKIFQLINTYRGRNGLNSLTWNQVIQDKTRVEALDMLKEGTIVYLGLKSPYVAQLAFNDRIRSGDTPDSMAQKAFDFWYSKSETKQILSGNYKSVAVGFVQESKETIYYLVVLFSIE